MSIPIKLPTGITKQAIDAATVDTFATGKAVILWDTSPRGLFVRIGPQNKKYPTGKITFGVHKRQAGRGSKAISLMFATYPDTSISDARDQAFALLAQIRSGQNPSQQRKDVFAQRRQEYQASKTNKFSLVCEAYRLMRIAESTTGPSDYFEKEMPAIFARYVLPHIGQKSLPEIRKDDIKTLLRAIPTLAMRGKTEAMLKPLFKYTLSEDIIASNPFEGIEPTPKPAPRDRVLTEAELKAFWLATADIIASDRPIFGYMYRALLLTAGRLREVSNLQFVEIHSSEGKIVIPGSRTKNRKPHWVPLATLLMQTLDQTPKKHKQFVFSYGRHAINGFTVAKSNLDTHMQRQLGAQLEPWVNHSLRDTFSTIMNSRGENPDHVDLCLGHTPRIKQGVQGKYNHYMYWPERQALMQRWSDYIEGLAKPITLLP